MLVISSREFRANQGKYLSMVANGEDVILKSRGMGSFKIEPVTEDDTLMSKEAFFAKIDEALEQAKRGEVYRMQDDESLSDFIKRIGDV